MYGTGFFPAEKNEYYEIGEDGLYLTGTSEVALAGLHMGEILDAERSRFATRRSRRTSGARPALRVATRAGCSACTSSTRSSSSPTRCRSSRGTSSSASSALEEANVQELGLPYRVVNISAGDLSSAAAKRYDIEAWFPSQERYRELTSASNTTDYQARRLGIRYRRDGSTEQVHTLNGTAVTDRWALAILENFQGEVPDVLRAVRRAGPSVQR